MRATIFIVVLSVALLSTAALADETDLVWSTFLGGMYDDWGRGIAVDGSGNAYVTGQTRGGNFPTTVGAFDRDYNGGGFSYGDVFVSKLNATGSDLVYSTYLGGSGSDYGHTIALDDEGNAYVTGFTASDNFPTTPGAFAINIPESGYDAFVSKLNSTGSDLVYSTYLGGNNHDYGLSIAVDDDDHAFVTGYTYSDDFPTTPEAFDRAFNVSDSSDRFVSKLNATGSDLVYSTYLGGSKNEVNEYVSMWEGAIAVDGDGNAYVTGATHSDDFPTTTGAFDRTLNSWDAFVAKLSSTGSALDYSTFLGGNKYDFGEGIAVDGAGNAYVTGWTASDTFPTTAGAFDETHNNYYDVFVTKLNSTGSYLVYSTYLGGNWKDRGEDIALDDLGCAYVTGTTESYTFPTTPGAFDTTYAGYMDAFIAKFNPTGSDLAYSTYLGRLGYEYGRGIAVDGFGNAYVTGRTDDLNFPVTSGAYDETYNMGLEAFVSKFGIGGGAIEGIVSEAKGPIEGAVVTARGVITGSDTTDASGYYLIMPLPTGQYDVTASATAFYCFTEKDVEVLAADTTTMDFFLSPLGDDLVWSTFLGGGDDDCSRDIAVDGAGCAYVTGYTISADFPTTSGAFDDAHNGEDDAFVAKLNPTGSDLVYATFLGGDWIDYGYSIAVDGAGCAYVTGLAWSANFPTTDGAFDEEYNGYMDVFVAKLDPTGSSLTYSTFLGGGMAEYGCSIAVDGTGNAYLTGLTNSDNFPTTAGAFDDAHNGWDDVFVAKLNPTGSDLVYSTYLGGNNHDYGLSMAMDGSGNAYLTGSTASDNFPTTTGAFDDAHNGENDVFVTKLSPTGSALDYSTFLGGNNSDFGQGIAVAGSGSSFVTGYTYSEDFPTIEGAFDPTCNGNSDVFVAKLNPTGSALDYSTFLGGSGWDKSFGIATDNSGSVYVTGVTGSASFPTTTGAFDDAHNGDSDVFVAKLKLEGTPVVSETAMGQLPKTCVLHQNYPNPFNPDTQIRYLIPQDSHVTLKIFNVMGQEIITLVDDDLQAGSYTATWNGRVAHGAEVAAGIYFCTMRTAEFRQTRKMVLLK